MFNIFKRKENTKIPETTENSVNIEEVKEKINNLKNEINENFDNEKKSEIYEKIGILYKSMEDNDNAIKYLEESLNFKKKLGDGYKALLTIYNQKRAEAAKSGQDEDIQYWLNKIDGLMQLSKDITRGVIK